MISLESLKLLSAEMDLEPAEDASTRPTLRANTYSAGLESSTACPTGRINQPAFVSQAVLPGGKPITLMKSLLTSACERNCYYCPFRAGRDYRRLTLKPQEMADVFMSLQRAGIVQGAFLSSGIAGGSVTTQDKLIATAEILRTKYNYRGYLHLKLMPGAEQAQIERSMQLADRVSINLEAPNTDRLQRLAPHKAFLDELLQPMKVVDHIRQSHNPIQAWNHRWPSLTTQYVVGAAGESDLELLRTTAYLHKNLHLSRAYFSAFRPLADTPFENLAPASKVREQRLYQASFLISDYGFQIHELQFGEDDHLPLHADPKTAWAQIHLAEQPIEINRADKSTLLRLPGIGPKSAVAILTARKKGRLQSLEDLHHIGVETKRAAPYILLDGRRPVQQLALF